jgi:hypothetical protein
MMDPTCVLSRCGHILVLQLCKLHFLRFVHLSIGRRYITIIVFAVIRVIGAIFLRDTLDAAQNDAEHLVAERCLAVFMSSLECSIYTYLHMKCTIMFMYDL